VEFQIQKHPQAAAAQLNDERRPAGDEQLQAHLHPAQLGQAIHQRQGQGGLWVIERHDDSISGISAQLWDHRGFTDRCSD